MHLELRRAAGLGVVFLALTACKETAPSDFNTGESRRDAVFWTRTPSDMTTARFQVSVNAIAGDGGNPVLVTGGFQSVGGAPTATAELFFPDAGAWSPAANMPTARARHASVTLTDGTVLVIGGRTASDVSRNTERYTYTLAGGAWASAGQMINGRADHTATLLGNGVVLVTGGLSLNSLPIAAAETWSPNLWVTTLPMSTPRAGHSATLLGDGRVFVAGGHDGTSAVASSEAYSVTLTSWTGRAAMATARQYHRALLVPSASGDKVLVTGGTDGSGAPLASAELYDVTNNTWTTVAPMAQARSEHSMTALPDGGVLVVGGVASSAYLSSAELFELPSSALPQGRWSPSGCTDEARAQHGAALLATGKVLVAGGRNAAALRSAEIHDPSGGLPNGAACGRGCECASQFCADGVCCDGACGGACDACDLAGSVGTCTAVDAGTPGAPACAPYLCGGASPSCPTSCSADPDCVSTHRCENNLCVPKKPIGETCTDPSHCATGLCVDGVCCDGVCTGACNSCNQPSRLGLCSPLAPGQQGSPSCAPYACDGVGAACPSACTSSTECASTHHCEGGQCVPKKPNGGACLADAECLTGFCVDGVCCDGRCAGSCDACNLMGTEGTCTVVPAGSAGDPVCAPFTCDGVSPDCPTACRANSECGEGARCIDGECQTRQRGYIGWGCSSTGERGGGLLLVLGAGLYLLRSRGRRGAAVLAVMGALAAADGWAAEDAPLRAASAAAVEPGAAELSSTSELQPEGSALGRALGRVHLGGYLLGDVVSQQVGGEVGISYAALPVLDVGAVGVLGDFMGLRAVGLLHPGPLGGSRWEPFVQLRAIVHPVRRSVGWGGGAWLGASYALGPGRIRGGVLGELYSGPSNFWPYAVVGAIGYEADPFKAVEVRERMVQAPTRVRGKITDIDDKPIKGKVTFRRAPPEWQGKVLEADPGFDAKIPPGDYELVAEADDYLTKGRTFTVNPGESVVVDIALRPKPGSKTARLTAERIEILQQIQFEFDKATILPQSFGILDEVVDILLTHPDLRIRIEGHTDKIGSAEYNRKLSTSRAASVRTYLIEKGVPAPRLTSVGHGFSKPLATNDTDEGRALNRRVQFEIVK